MGYGKEFVKCYNLEDFKGYSDARIRALALCAAVGVPRYKIYHSQVIADTALIMADELYKQKGIQVDKETCEIGALLHDVGLSQIPTDDMPEHAYIGALIAKDAGFSQEICNCIEFHDGCGGFVKEYCDLLDLPKTDKDREDLLPRTWEEKIVAYADTFITLYGEAELDIWNDDDAAKRGSYAYLEKPVRVRRGLCLPFDHPQLEYACAFNKEMRQFLPRERVEKELKAGIEAMVRALTAENIKTPFYSTPEWPPVVWPRIR